MVEMAIWQLWLIIIGSAVLGALVGLFLAACCFVSSEQERQQRMERDR